MSALHSIRARLTAWYVGVFALFALAFALATYAFVARATAARVDESLAETAGRVVDEVQRAWRLEGREGAAVAAALDEFRLGDVAVGILDRPSGTVALAFETGPEADRVGNAVARVPSRFSAALAAAPARAAYVTLDGAPVPARLFMLPIRLGDRALVVGVARSLVEQRRTLREARLALAAGVPLLLLAAGVGGYLLARRSLRPVADMAERAARIGAATLHERLPVRDPRDELGRLAEVFNELLDRLDAAFDRQRQFVADASHELRTPVAVVSGEAELALSRPDRPAPQLREALAVVAREAAHLNQIVEDLFLLARAGAGQRVLAMNELYLGDAVADAARAARTLAERRGVALACEVRGDLPMRGDEGLLRRLVLNLLQNAVKYTPPGGDVRVTAERRGVVYTVEVRDTGPGVDPAARERIFDRFFRARAARDADGAAPEGGGAGGAGLGLPIARSIAEAHGGTLELATSDRHGSTFRLTLPAPADAD